MGALSTSQFSRFKQRDFQKKIFYYPFYLERVEDGYDGDVPVGLPPEHRQPVVDEDGEEEQRVQQGQPRQQLRERAVLLK